MNRLLCFGKAPLLGAFLFLATLPSYARDAQCEGPGYAEEATVEYVYDGDTVRLQDGRKLRFIGINTPELAHEERAQEPLAAAARDYLQKRLQASPQLRLVPGRKKKDRYGRLLAHPFLADGTNLVEEMIEQGLGFALVVPPDTGFLACFQDAERRARSGSAGIWSHAYFRPLPASSVPPHSEGFRRLTGRVQRIGQGSKNVYLDLGPQSEIRIHRKDLKYFPPDYPDTLLGKTIMVKGWLRKYKRKWQMQLRHPAMLELDPSG